MRIEADSGYQNINALLNEKVEEWRKQYAVEIGTMRVELEETYKEKVLILPVACLLQIVLKILNLITNAIYFQRTCCRHARLLNQSRSLILKLTIVQMESRIGRNMKI